MSAPSSLPLTSGPGRSVGRRRTGRRCPRHLEEIGSPDITYPDPPGTWRPVPVGDYDPARARWVRLVLDDPAAARRERLEARLAYWRGRVEALEMRFLSAKRAVIDALKPTEGADGRPLPPAPPAVLFELRARRAAAWADVQHARARLEECERELAMEEKDGCNARRQWGATG